MRFTDPPQNECGEDALSELIVDASPSLLVGTVVIVLLIVVLM